MPRLTAHVEEPTKQAWRRLAKERGLSESALLAAVATAAANQIDKLDLSGYTNRERGGERTKIDIRLKPAEDRAVRAAAKSDGLPSRQAWIIALIRGRLLHVPTPSAAELAELRESNRQLAAIGRNLNQVAHAVNIDFRERTRLTGHTLEQLHASVMREQKAVKALASGTLGRWTGRGREDEDAGE